MRWSESDGRGGAQAALFPGQLKRLLVGRTITAVSDHEGRPGGHNNDQLTLTLDDGSKLRVDAYAMSGMVVTREGPPPGNPGGIAGGVMDGSYDPGGPSLRQTMDRDDEAADDCGGDAL
jgi:hypothetical protein